MSKKKLTFGNVVLCEHAVPGAGNKHTLINVFSGDVVVSEMPARLSFGIYIEIGPNTASKLQLELKLGRKVFGRLEAQVPTSDDGARATGVVVVPLLQVGIDEDLDFQIVGRAEGYSATTFLKKRIFLGPIPS